MFLTCTAIAKITMCSHRQIPFVLFQKIIDTTFKFFIECCRSQCSFFFTGTDAKSCIGCIVGRYQSETGQASCLPCIPGSFMNITGALECFTCGKNEKSEDAGAKECDICGVGEKSEAGYS